MKKSKERDVCVWYSCCPIHWFTDQGRLDPYWVNNYCLVANHDCIRYQMESKGKYHPDNMLPDGSIDPSLSN
ncbi:MAG: uracil-DNA glycosylase [Promethearchaeota archaeon]